MSLKEELDKIVLEWESDSVINEARIEAESLYTPHLHSKYLNLLKVWKYQKLGCEIEYNEMKQFKFRYWRGECSKEELRERGLPQWQNNKPLKSELEAMANGDSELNKIKFKVELIETGIEIITQIIKQISARDFEISNYIKMRKFNEGEF